ncbi:MAG: hypothetical protein DRJ03_04035 [Chloroflexi bacterium]|nr:MAG: hypothetical protein DRJ03_04035 [Chloroflexota bacterium]
MMGIQEMVQKDELQPLIKEVKQRLDDGYFDWDEFGIVKHYAPGNPEKRKALMENLRRIPLREFLAKSGTTGIAGAAYLIPDKIYQVMFDSAVEADIVADISIAMIPADQIPGSTLKVDIAVDESYKPKKYSSGASMPTETIKTVQATLDFTTSWGINFQIANDLIEDSQFDVIEMHLRNAGREMGEFASNEALTVLKTATDGDGTVNSANTGDADETKFRGGTTSDIKTAIKGVVDDGYTPDTMVVTHEAMLHSIIETAGAQYAEVTLMDSFVKEGWPSTLAGMNVVYSDVDTLTNSKAFTDCVTIVFDKDYALLSGRKRWLRIEKYSDPIRDLAGATVTARQDSVTVYNDSIYVLTES